MTGQEFIKRLQEKGVKMAFALYEEPEGHEKNLIFEKDKFFLMDLKEKTLVKITPDEAMEIIERINGKALRVKGAGSFNRSIVEKAKTKGGILK